MINSSPSISTKLFQPSLTPLVTSPSSQSSTLRVAGTSGDQIHFAGNTVPPSTPKKSVWQYIQNFFNTILHFLLEPLRWLGLIKASPKPETTQTSKNTETPILTAEHKKELHDLLEQTGTLKAMDAQTKAISVEVIQNVINQFPPSKQAQALKVLAQLSQFGNMESLNVLQCELLKQHEKGYRFYVTKEGALASTLHYLHLKNTNSHTPIQKTPFESQLIQSGLLEVKNNSLHLASNVLNDLKKGNQKAALILDRNVLHLLTQNPQLVAEIKTHQVKLFYPDGWEEGINPFNQTTDSNVLKAKIDQILASKQNSSEQVSYSVRQALETLGLTANLEVIYNTTPQQVDINTIVSQLKPAKLDEDTLISILAKFKKGEHRQAAAQLLKDHAHIFTPAGLSEIHKTLHQQILEYAQTKGSAKKDIYYYIPKAGKSYGITTMQHQLVNDIAPDNIITDRATLNKKVLQNPKAMVVILDDVAASGFSLSGEAGTLQDGQHALTLPKDRLILAPIISTDKASNHIQSSEKVEKQESILKYIPGKSVTALRSFFKSTNQLSPEQEAILGNSLGLTHQGMNIVFPYMAPDNNNAFFATHIAPHYTLNQAGVKVGEMGELGKTKYEFPS